MPVPVCHLLFNRNRIPVSVFFSSFPTLLCCYRQLKICDQFAGRFVRRQTEQAGSQPDHISFCSAGKTVIISINFHAGMMIVMKRTACHLVPADPDPVLLRRLPCGNV